MTAIIDLGALRANLAVIRERVAPSEPMIVVKADAYGHGLEQVAQLLVEEGVAWIGALDLDTASRLRAAAVPADVRIFVWLHDTADADAVGALDQGFDIGISTLAQLESAARSAKCRIHLKIDTGLHRAGASVEDWPPLVARALELQAAGRVDLVGAWTHIAEAGDEEDSDSIARFFEAVAVAEGLGARFAVKHLAASAASFARAEVRLDLVRVGAFAYGIAPGDGIGPQDLGLVPAMTLTAPVLESVAGVTALGIGAADGLQERLADRVTVAIAGTRYPVTDVELDRLLVDTGDVRIGAGQTAFLWGTGAHGEATLQEWADATGTIGEELVTRLSPRVAREYVGKLQR
ncbi:alanine racemase [soil metagenome]